MIQEIITYVEENHHDYPEYDDLITDLKDGVEYSAWASCFAKKDELNNKEYAKALFKLDLDAHKSPTELVYIAKQICDEEGLADTIWANEILESALVKAKDSDDFMSIAEVYASNEMLEYKDKSRKIYNDSVSSANTAEEFRLIADSIILNLECRDLGLEVYHKSFSAAETAEDFRELGCCLAYADNLIDDKLGLECFKKSEAICASFDDIWTLADNVTDDDYLGDKDWGRSIYQKALDKAEDFQQFFNVAGSLCGFLDDKDWGREIFMKALDMAETDEDREAVADAVEAEYNLDDAEWAEEIRNQCESSGDPQESNDGNEDDENISESMSEFLNKVQEKYSDHDDLEEMLNDLKSNSYLNHWAGKFFDEDDLNDTDMGKELLKVSEELANSSSEYCDLGKIIGLKSGCNDSEWAKEVFKVAIEKAEDFGDLHSVAEGILCDENLGDHELGKTVIQMCMDKSDSSSELCETADLIAQNNYLRDKSWGREIYNQALAKAEDVTEMTEIARSICNVESLNDKNWGREIFIKASEHPDCDGSLMSDLAWDVRDDDYLGDEQLSEEFFRKAVEMADDSTKKEILKRIHRVSEELAEELKNQYDIDLKQEVPLVLSTQEINLHYEVKKIKDIPSEKQMEEVLVTFLENCDNERYGFALADAIESAEWEDGSSVDYEVDDEGAYLPDLADDEICFSYYYIYNESRYECSGLCPDGGDVTIKTKQFKDHAIVTSIEQDGVSADRECMDANDSSIIKVCIHSNSDDNFAEVELSEVEFEDNNDLAVALSQKLFPDFSKKFLLSQKKKISDLTDEELRKGINKLNTLVKNDPQKYDKKLAIYNKELSRRKEEEFHDDRDVGSDEQITKGIEREKVESAIASKENDALEENVSDNTFKNSTNKEDVTSQQQGSSIDAVGSLKSEFLKLPIYEKSVICLVGAMLIESISLTSNHSLKLLAILCVGKTLIPFLGSVFKNLHSEK